MEQKAVRLLSQGRVRVLEAGCGRPARVRVQGDTGVRWLLPTRYRLPLLVLDATGMRLGELEGAPVG